MGIHAGLVEVDAHTPLFVAVLFLLLFFVLLFSFVVLFMTAG